MNGEIKSLVKVWSIAIAMICYCYFIASRIPKGILRLISLFPVIFIFFILPLNLHAFHFCCLTAFFLAWLGNFKLLLFAFDLEPLSPPLPSLVQFIAVLCLPIKIKKHPSPRKPHNRGVEIELLVLGLKVLLLSYVVRLYEYKERLNPDFVFVLYCINVCLEEEIVFFLCSLPAKALLGAPLHRQFNKPYLSTSLQDFWGRRWNLMVPAILRPTVYNLVRNLTAGVIGPKPAKFLAMISAFTVSGLMHELLYYYVTLVSPTWEVTLFFILHGICTAAEVAAKETLTWKFGLRLHPAVSWPLTLGFLMLTSKWLLFPQLIRNGVVEKVIGEHLIMINFVKDKLRLLF